MSEGDRILNAKGFTLVEIIAVIVLLGVLAAAAVPKYFDLTTNAKKASAKAALAEGMARVNLKSGQLMLSNGSAQYGGVVATALSADTAAGDFTLNFSGAAAAYVVSITAYPNGATADTVTTGYTFFQP